MNKIKLKNLTKIVFSTVFVCLISAVAPVYAFNGATLSEIKISSKNNHGYKIIFKTDKDISVKKHITSDNKIVIDLANAKSAEFVNIIYDNTPEIDNIIVQTATNNKIKIFIQGLNIASSKIVLDSENFMKKTNLAISANAQPPVINLAQKLASNSNFKKIFNKENFDWFLRIFAIIFIAINIFKLISKPKNVIIDIASENLKGREIELYKAANERKELLSKSLRSNYTKEKQAVKKTTCAVNFRHEIK